MSKIKLLITSVLLLMCVAAAAATFNLFTPVTGILKGNAATYVTTLAVSSDIIGLWTGACNSGTFLRGDGSCQTPAASLSGTTPSIGGGALLAGACASDTVTVAGAITSMVSSASPNTYPGDGSTWSAQVTSSNTVTVRVCATVALTPTASTYNVRVLQ